jgi:hypothetical protein
MMLAPVVFDYVSMNEVYLTMNYLHLSLLHYVTDAIDDDEIDVRQSD